MQTYKSYDVDAVVVGAGHAGCEAALALARLGLKTIIMTVNLDGIALMACNPAIGGTAKGHLVREIDALGGQMGINADAAMLQMKMLNLSKGPAVYSLRAQEDKKLYTQTMKETLENQDNLMVLQAEAAKIIVEDGKVCGVETATGALIGAKAVVLATGVYLKSRIIIGEYIKHSGPSGLASADLLTESLIENGLKVMRFKTGTPARVDRRSIDFSKMIIQEGDDPIVPFSFMTDKLDIEQEPCYLAYTNERTHEIIRANLHRSPLYDGTIKGKGPRYCPSFEGKVVTFADKERHQLFVEPEAMHTNEVYMQGMSSSLPEEVQLAFLRTIEGLENCVVMRTGYAIEYDLIDPKQLKPSLELKSIDSLFAAGQINGSSGYEEAAAQGIIAGINAAMKIKGQQPLILSRDEAYIGVLIDDLVTKELEEPYRMMTSRAEYRLLLRQDNADLRLTEYGRSIGLVSDERYARYLAKKEKTESELIRYSKTVLSPKGPVADFLATLGQSVPQRGVTLEDLLKRQGVTYDDIIKLDPKSAENSPEVREQIAVAIKYKGYIDKQIAQAKRQKSMENIKLPEDIDYTDIGGLRLEATEKLKSVRPLNLGQASRILGVSPSDISVLMVYLEKRKRERTNEKE